jgi:hypothetical protein
MWLRRVATADVISALLDHVPAPVTGAVPAYGHVPLPAHRA